MGARLFGLAFFVVQPLCAQESSRETEARAIDEVAAEAETVAVKAEGLCPSAAHVERELKPLLKKWKLAEPPGPANIDAQVIDSGDFFRVMIETQVREIENSPPDCQERARVAAVIIAMQLETPLGSSEEPSEEPAAPEQPVARHEQKRTASARPGWWAIQGDLLVAGGIDDVSPVGWGPRLALSYGRGDWLLRASVGMLFFSRLTVDDISLDYSRLPTDIAVGRIFRTGAWSWTPSLALALDPFWVEAVDAGSGAATRLDVGTRLGFQVAQTAWPLRPSLELQASWFPRDFQLYISPQGELARTANFWMGASLGGAFVWGEP